LALKIGQPLPRKIALRRFSSGEKLLYSYGGHEKLPIHIAYG